MAYVGVIVGTCYLNQNREYACKPFGLVAVAQRPEPSRYVMMQLSVEDYSTFESFEPL